MGRVVDTCKSLGGSVQSVREIERGQSMGRVVDTCKSLGGSGQSVGEIERGYNYREGVGYL